MAETSGFFPSYNGDRKYFTAFFAEYFADFIGNGIYPNPSTQCQVLANGDMTVTLKPGNAYINGYRYKNDSDKTLTLETADGVLKRIDRIVIRSTTLDREIKAYIKKGTFASTPVAPELQRDADMWELGVADIYVANGAVSISQANITDLRLNDTYCGIVSGVVDQVDTTTLFNQYLSKYAEIEGLIDSDIAALKAGYQSAWDTWFSTIQSALDGDTAGNLLNMINALTDRVAAAANDLYQQQLADRREILDIKLKLEEAAVIDFLNKTGIGFYDLFADTSNVDTLTTTATVSGGDVTFTGTKILQMDSQTFSDFAGVDLALYDKERVNFTITVGVTNSDTISMDIAPGSRTIGEKFFYNGDVYTITNVVEV